MPLDTLADYESAPFQFPLEDYIVTGDFNVTSNWNTFAGKRHAAEDIIKPAEASVYATADGIIRYSGKRDGYGWLIIIDHPQANVYSLYGHLSPSQWAREVGPVAQGELIGYLGHGYENGYNKKHGYMEPHLHFGIRVGQRADYSENGDRRWMAGWTYACPESIGWMQPSAFIEGYAKGEVVIPSENPYRAKGADVAKVFWVLSVVGVVWNVVSGVRMNMALREHNVGKNMLMMRYMPWRNVNRYKQITTEQTGKPGPLFYHFMIANVVAVFSGVATIVLLITG